MLTATRRLVQDVVRPTIGKFLDSGDVNRQVKAIIATPLLLGIILFGAIV